MKIALASPEFEVLPYTGKQGLYSAVTPDDTGCYYLLGLASVFDLNPEAHKFHVTVMYAPDVFPNAAPSVNQSKVFAGRIHCVDWWRGHSGKGYLTARIISSDLQAAHRDLLRQGCKHTYSPYMPHVTLWSDIAKDIGLSNKMARLNSLLAGDQPAIHFTNQVVSDIKPD